jgi:ribosome biogenesis protein MAK21
VYKNPKKLRAREGDADGVWLGKGPSAMQPAASGIEGVKLVRGEVGYAGEEVVNEKAFLRKKRENVPVDQLFFHDYFMRKYQKEKSPKEKREFKDATSDHEDNDQSSVRGAKDRNNDWGEDIDSDAEEAEIWQVCFLRVC